MRQLLLIVVLSIGLVACGSSDSDDDSSSDPAPTTTEANASDGEATTTTDDHIDDQADGEADGADGGGEADDDESDADSRDEFVANAPKRKSGTTNGTQQIVDMDALEAEFLSSTSCDELVGHFNSMMGEVFAYVDDADFDPLADPGILATLNEEIASVTGGAYTEKADELGCGQIWMAQEVCASLAGLEPQTPTGAGFIAGANSATCDDLSAGMASGDDEATAAETSEFCSRLVELSVGLDPEDMDSIAELYAELGKVAPDAVQPDFELMAEMSASLAGGGTLPSGVGDTELTEAAESVSTYMAEACA